MADGKIDTGTGGINIGGDLYTFDTGLPEDDGGSQGTWSPGNITVDNSSTPDLTVKTKLTLGRYMSDATLGKVSHYTRPNDFPVDPPTEASVILPTITDPTTQSPMGPIPTSNEKIFSPVIDLSMTSPKIAGFKRGAAAGKVTDQNGNTLLPLAVGPAPAGGPYVKFSTLGLAVGPVKLLTDQQLSNNPYVPSTPSVVIGDGGDVAPSGLRDFYVPGGSFLDFGTADGIRTDMSDGILHPGESSAAISRKRVLNQLVLLPYFSTLYVNSYPITPAANGPNLISLVDPVTKIPASATDASNNPSNAPYYFAPAWQFSSYTTPLIAAGNANKFFIHRGMWQNGTGISGNELLPKNADLIANDYTKIVLDPNLYSPLDATPVPDVVIGDGGNALPDNLRDLHVVVSSAQDGGTSKNILSPDADHTLTLIEAVAVASSLTTKNVFPLDSAVVGGKPNLVKLIDPAGYPMRPAAPDVTSYFTKIIPLQSTYTKFTKNLSIKRGLAAGPAPDGNTLLPLAAAFAPAGGQYVKASGGLNEPVSTFTKDQLTTNLYDPLAASPPQDVVIGDGGNVAASNLRPLHPTVDLATDGGSSDNILKPDGAHTLAVESAASRATVETGKNKYPVGGVDIVNKVLQTRRLVDPSGNPISATAAQANPTNPSFFTKGRFFASSYTPAAGLVKIRRGLTTAPSDAQDGDDLLPSAAKPGPAGGPHVKDSGGLNPNVAGYTTAVIGPNLYDYDSQRVNVTDPTDVDFRGFHRTSSISVDGGTSEHVMNPGKFRTGGMTSLRDLATEPYVITSTTNRYPVSPPSPIGGFRTVSLETDGKPVSPTDSQTNPSNGYEFVSWKDSPEWNSYTAEMRRRGISVGMHRGAASADGVDGNNILRKGNTPAPQVSSYVMDLLGKNRFNPDRTALDSTGIPGIPDQINTSDLLTGGGGHSLMRFAPRGAYQMGKSLSWDTDRNLGFNRLANIGNVLQLRAAGEISTLITDSTDPRSPGTTALDLLPGLGQIDIPRPVSVLDIKEIISNLTENPVVEYNDDIGKTFQGQLNHMEETFSSFAAIGMIVLTVAMVAVIIAFYDLLGLLFGLNSDSKINGASPTRYMDVGRPGVGTFHGRAGGQSPASIISAFIPLPGKDSSVLMRFFGFGPTKRPFLDAVISGTTEFFGLAGSGTTSGAAGFFSMPAFQSPGYFVTMARSIVRSVVLLVYDFKNLGKLLMSNPFAGILGIFEVLGKIRDSRMIKALNVFAMVGDNSGADDPHDMTKEEVDAGRKISKSDSILDSEPGASFSKSRLKGSNFYRDGLPLDSTLKLAWASNRTPDVLLKSARSLSYMANSADYSSQRLISMDPLEKTRYEFLTDKDGGRIDNDARINMEKDFESEYVPFYFHDLRTNELLGFHAFLTNLSDNFAPQYESVDAYGRVDPVKIYKSTSRKISLSFIIASTDRKDFDSMWTKINKLVTLVYPQYTVGREISMGNYRFIRPFTQQIGASPMVRLRVGDVISSNYSKFNLAGIFGAFDSPTAKFAGSPSSPALSKFEDLLDPSKRSQFFTKILDDPDKASYQFLVKSRKYRPVKTNMTGFDSFDPGDYPDVFYAQVSVWKDPTLVGPTASPSSAATYKNNTFAISFKRRIDTPASFEAFNRYKSDSEKTINKALKGMDDGTTQMFATADDLVDMTADSWAKFNKKYLAGDGDAAFAKALGAFMDDSKSGGNSISRSFRSSGGRGIAGFIDSLDFDWLGQTRWEIDVGSRAPMMCKVTMGFTPIHDISPGLDSSGRNRAPVYSVGPYYTKNL